MKRLRGRDAFTIYSETESSPFVTLKVGLYKPVDPKDTPNAEDLVGLVKGHLATIGGKRASLRIVRVPFDLHHPVWVYDPTFSPDNHIFKVTLPAPGGKKELCDFLSELMSKPLNPERPLWEIWIVDGLEDHRLAIVFKSHHALADGKMMAEFISRSHAEKGDEDSCVLKFEGEPIPGDMKLLGDAVVDLAKSLTIELPHFYRHYKKIREAISEQADEEEVDQADEQVGTFSAPVTVLDGVGGKDREYWYETFSLSDFKAISKKFGCTINDLVLAVASEALKRYLRDIDDLPDKSLVACMPVAGQQENPLKVLVNSDILNNDKVAIALVPLHQGIEEFSERVTAIHNSSRAAIRKIKRTQGKRFDNYFDFIPGFFVRQINDTVFKRSIKGSGSAYANIVISNVPGPREALYALDKRLQLDELLSTGNLADGGHLNVTVWSYVDKISFSFYMRKGHLPEHQKLPEHFRSFIAELNQQYLTDT